MTKILVLSGSIRSGSLNCTLAALAAKKLQAQGFEVTSASLSDYAMPFYDGDLEAKSGPPENAIKLAKLFADHQGIFIASPEYNASFSALLKNALDWMSRVKLDAGSVFKNKAFTLGAASPGAMGGYRGLTQLREMLSLGVGALVLPEMIAVGNAPNAFDSAGEIKDTRTSAMLDSCLAQLHTVARMHKNA